MTPLALGLALTLAAPAPKDPPKKDPPGPIGRWALQSASLAGVPLPDMKLTLTFTADGRYESKTPEGEVKSSGTFAADPKKQPAEIDMTEAARPVPTATPAIYRIEGDTLTICTTIGNERPTAFDAKAGANNVLLVFKRLKD